MPIKLENVYTYLVNEEDARACNEISDEACTSVPANFFLILLSQFITKLADACSSAKIVLPWLLNSMGAPAFIVGLLVPIRESGSLIPQLLLGGVIRRFGVRKWFFVAGALAQGLCLLLMAIVGITQIGTQSSSEPSMLQVDMSGTTAGAIIIGLLILFSLARGVCSVASKDVLGKTIPKTRRGRVAGYSASAAGVITVLVAAVLFLDLLSNDNHYILLLLFAFICWLCAAVVYAGISEFKGETDGGKNALIAAIHNMRLLKSDKHFRHFITVRALLMSSGLAAPYFILLATQQAARSPDASHWTNLAAFLGVSGIASMVSGGFWGKFADSSSRQLMVICALFATILCTVASYVSYFNNTGGMWLPVALFFLLSIVHQGVRLGRKTYVVDMAKGNRRTDYVAVGNTFMGLLLLTVGILSALLAQLSQTAVFGFFAISSALGCMLARNLPEV